MDSAVIYSIPGFSEPFSSMSHLIAALVMLLLGSKLVYLNRCSRKHLLSYSIFIFSCVFLLSMSGVFHLLEPNSVARNVLQRLDHAAIFVLIAGTFTAIQGIMFVAWWRWAMLIPIWIIAITSLSLKVIFFNDFIEWFGLLMYLSLGWLGVISAILLHQRYGFKFIRPLIWGAIAYTSGAVLEFIATVKIINGVIESHELFHITVLFGLGFHFYFVSQFSIASKNYGS